RGERLAGELADQLLRKAHLAVAALAGIPETYLVEVADLVGVVERVEDQALRRRPDEDQALLAAAHVLRDGHHLTLAHGVGQQVEARSFRMRRYVELDRDRHQPEAHRPRPHRACRHTLQESVRPGRMSIAGAAGRGLARFRWRARGGAAASSRAAAPSLAYPP